MSHLVASSAPIAAAHTVKRYPGFGILGADIPDDGGSGPSPVLNDSPSPTAEYHWRVEAAPSAGVLTIYPDLTFEWDSSGAADGSYPWVYRLFENGVSQGTATVSQTLGAAGVSLAIADAAHAHTADALALSTAATLSVADALHGHTADNVTLGLAGVANLLIADATHSHAADNLALTSAHSLAIADATHAHTADALTLASAVSLVVQDATHAHTAESLILDTSNAIVLTIADALHAHTADSIVISADVYLSVLDSIHAHYADNIVLQVLGALFTPEQLAYILAYVEANIVVPTAEQIADAVWQRATRELTQDVAGQVLAALNATTIPVDIRKVNNITVAGGGTEANPWGPQ